jgi:hypothetical protein
MARLMSSTVRGNQDMNVTSQIREHMDVISSDKKTVGKVDHLEGTDKIKPDQAELAGWRAPPLHSGVVGRPRRPARPSQQVGRRRDIALAARPAVTG